MATTPSPTEDYDFGFSFADEEAANPQVPQPSNEELTALQSKLDSLLSAQEKTLETALLKSVEEKYRAKLKEVEGMILPLLVNLKKNPDKAYIHWPNRGPVIDKQIEKITTITRG